jgi:hypothetical protein
MWKSELLCLAKATLLFSRSELNAQTYSVISLDGGLANVVVAELSCPPIIEPFIGEWKTTRLKKHPDGTSITDETWYAPELRACVLQTTDDSAAAQRPKN